MQKLQQIKRIDLLVHPFISIMLDVKNKVDPSVYDKWLEVWKKHIDEIAADGSRMMLFNLTPEREWTKEQKRYTDELLEHAKKKLGSKMGFFTNSERVGIVQDVNGKGFKSFSEYATKNGFIINPNTVQTRGLGEYLYSCVFETLKGMNKKIGLKNPMPFRNKQSALITRKSWGFLEPWNLQQLRKTNEGKLRIRRAAQEYIRKMTKIVEGESYSFKRRPRRGK